MRLFIINTQQIEITHTFAECTVKDREDTRKKGMDWNMNSDIRIVTIRINQNILIIHTFTKFLLNPEFAFA